MVYNLNSYDKIGVVIPVYNVEPFLRRCVDSVLAQTYKNIDIILVDDGSTDQSGMICDEYSEFDSRIHVIHQKNAGLSGARNTGIDWLYKNSDFNWIFFIDSDDWIHEKTCQILYEAVYQYKRKISVCNYELTDGVMPIFNINAVNVQVYDVEDFNVRKTLNSTLAWGKLYHKSLFTDIRYPIGKIHEDEYTTYKVLFKEQSLVFVDLPLYAYFNNISGITKSKWKPSRLDAIEAIENQISFFDNNSYYNASKKSKYKLIDTLASQIFNITEKEHIKYKKRLRKVLRKKIRIYSKEGVINFNNNKFYYEQAYPNIMGIYWILLAQRNKFKKRG